MARILIVDDEQPIRQILLDALEIDKHEICEAGSGQEAMALVQEQVFDLLITDLVMPEKNGIDLIMEIKDKYPQMRIIAISGGGGITGRFDYLPIARLIGAGSILRKPFRLPEIRSMVRQVLAENGGG